MRISRKSTVIFLAFLLVNINLFGQLVINPTLTPAQLVQNILVQGGLSISNITYTGSTGGTGGSKSQIGSFTNANTSYLGLKSGIVLSSGYVDHIAAAGNANGNMSDATGTAGDADLAKVAGVGSNSSYDASVLAFDFIPTGNTVSFTYVFGSEEYPKFVCSEFDDAFGFFLSGPGITGPYSNNSINIALIPGSSPPLPVEVNSINNGITGSDGTTGGCVSLAYSSLYVNNLADPYIVFGGMTKVFTATHSVTPCQKYHIKLAVCDLGDEIYDSSVLLGANSFNTGGVSLASNYSNSSAGKNAIINCSNGVFMFSTALPVTSSTTIKYTIGGTATNGVDYSKIPDSVTIKAGYDTASVIIQPILNGFTGTVIITATVNCQTVSDTVKIIPYVPMNPITSGTTQICTGKSTTIGVTNSGGVNPYSYNWSNGLGTGTSYSVTPAVTTTYTVTATDKCGQTATSNVVVTVDPYPAATATSNSVICSGNTLNLTSGPNAALSYSWAGPNNFSSTSQNPSISNVTTSASGIYTVTVTGTGGCASTTQTSVTINATPTPSAGSNSMICSGNTLSLTSSGGTSYNWAGPNSFNGTSQNPTISAATIAASGTYIVTVTGTGGCSSTAQTLVTVNSTPVVTIGSNSILCSGNTLNLTSGPSGESSYNWAGPNSFSSTSQNPSIVSATTAASGNYSVTITGIGGCTSIGTEVVEVNATPVASAGNNSSICSGGTLNLTSGPNGGSTYSWAGPNSFSSLTQNPSITPASILASGTYFVTVTAVNGCTSTASTVVNINQSPVVNAGNNVTIPNGFDTILNATVSGGSGLYNYNWSPSDSLLNPTVQSPTTVNLAGTTTFAVTVTDQTTGCTGTSQVIVNISGGPLNVNSLTVTPSAFCKGDSSQIEATATGGSGNYTYSWSPATGLSSTSIYNPIASPTTTSTYTVSVFDGHNTVSDQLTITIYPLPTPTASSNTPCEGQVLNLTSGGGTSYLWAGPVSFSSSSQDTSISPVTLSEAGIYTVTVTNSNGCTATAQTIVAVNNTPNATASGNTPCAGQPLILISGGGTTYNWAGPDSFISSSQDNTISNVSTSEAGTYTVTVTNGNGCTATAQTIINVNNNPVATASGNTPCEGQTIYLVSGGGISYNWSGPNSFSDGTQDPTIPNADTALSSGIYSVTVTNANGCSSTAQTNVTINSNPIATASSNTPCEGQTLNLNSGGGTFYNWAGPNSFSSNNQNITINTISISAAGIYAVTVTNSNGCSSTAQTSVTINSNPIVTVSSNTPCDGQSLNLTSGGGTTFIWSGPDSFSSTDQNPSISLSTLSDAGVYIVTVTNTNGCSNTAQISVIVNSNPIAIASGNTPCEGQTLSLTSGGGSTYNWAGPNSFSSSSQNPSINGALSADAGIYLVTVTNSNGCSATAQATISINPNPIANIYSNTPCKGQTLNLTSGGGSTYNWAGPNSFSSSSQSPSINSVALSAAGIYTVTVTNTQGCFTTESISVNINALPVVSINIPENVYCKGANPVTLKGTPTGGYFSGTGITNDSIFNPALVADTGHYELVYSYTDTNSCFNSDSAIVSVISKPTVSLQSVIDASIQIYTGEIVTITASPTNYTNYAFYIGNNLEQSGTSNTYQSNTLINGDIVKVDISEGGCVASDSIPLNIKPIPNAFIPNGSDAENQIFLKGLDLQIFNRWDQMLYSGSDGWNGEFNGKLVSPGTYFYVVKLHGLNNEIIVLKGSVTLVAK